MKHLFFIAFFRALEKQIPDQTDFERMINASDLESAFKILQDTYYGPYLTNFQAGSFEDLFEEESLKFRETLKRLGLEDEILEFLSLRAELFNLGIILKEELFKIKAKEEGFLKKGIFQAGVLRKKYSSLIKELKSTKPNKVSQIDDFLIGAYFQKMTSLAQSFKEKKLVEFFNHHWQILENQGKEMAETEDIIEKVLSEREMEFLNRTKWESQGLLPIFAFFLRKEYSQKVLRIIFSAKEIGLQIPQIRQLLQAVPALI